MRRSGNVALAVPVTDRYGIATLVVCLALFAAALTAARFHQIGNLLDTKRDQVSEAEIDFYGRYALEADSIKAGKAVLEKPGYAMLLAGFSIFAGDYYAAAKGLSAAAFLGFGILTFLLIRSLYDSRVAFVTAAFSQFALVPYSFIATTDLPGAFFILLALWVFLRMENPSSLSCLLSGMIAGFAYLIRTNAFFLVPGIGIALLFVPGVRMPIRPRVMRLGLFVLGAFIFVAPWFLSNWIKFGSPAHHLSLELIDSRYGSAAAPPDSETVGAGRKPLKLPVGSVKDLIVHDPLGFAKQFMRMTFVENDVRLVKTVLGFPVYLFAIPGIFFLLRDAANWRRIAFFLLCLLGFGVLGLMPYMTRFYLFLYPVLFLPVAYCLFESRIAAVLGRSPVRAIGTHWILFAGIGVLLLGNSCRAAVREITSEPRYLLEIAAFLRGRSLPEDRMISRDPYLSYYSGLRKKTPPEMFSILEESPEKFLAVAKKDRLRYLVYTDRDASFWKVLKKFADPAGAPEGYRLIYSHEPSTTRVYELDFGKAAA